MNFTCLKKLVLFFVFICSLTVRAIEYEFDGGYVTALGGITSQPAGLGYLDSKYSFAASASALEFTNHNIRNNSFEQDNSPMSFKPVFVGSAMSTAYGGWSLLIFNTENEYRAALDQNQGADITNSTITLNSKTFNILVSAGLRLQENWSIGWGFVINQLQVQTTSETYSLSGGNSTVALSDSFTQLTSMNANMGFLFSLKQFVLGVKLSSPSSVLAKSGKTRTRILSSPSGTYTDENKSASLANATEWNIDVGLRFGRNGFAYILGDSYGTDGRHDLNAGFEYVAGWGSIASGINYSDYASVRESRTTVGFVKDHKNFKWGVGPFYQTISDSTPGSFNTKTFGIIYSSEIRY